MHRRAGAHNARVRARPVYLMSGCKHLLIIAWNTCGCRSCCDRWLGHKMLVAGRFRAECPVCKQVDAGFKPTPTALQVRAVQYC